MGKKLTEQEIEGMIIAKPNRQMFDQCSVCKGVEDYNKMNSVEEPDSFDLICNECEAKREVPSMLIDIFDRIDIQTPSNFDQILDFIYKDMNLENENWNDGDVAFSFKRWIESNSK